VTELIEEALAHRTILPVMSQEVEEACTLHFQICRKGHSSEIGGHFCNLYKGTEEHQVIQAREQFLGQILGKARERNEDTHLHS